MLLWEGGGATQMFYLIQAQNLLVKFLVIFKSGNPYLWFFFLI
jgi:hypothetical protein